MERKNNISKYNIESEDDDNNENYNNNDDMSIKEHDIIWNTRVQMIEYCDYFNLPLCDYLDIDKFYKFVEFIKSSLS